MKKIFNTLLVVAMLLVQIIPTTLVRADDTKPAITINKAVVDEIDTNEVENRVVKPFITREKSNSPTKEVIVHEGETIKYTIKGKIKNLDTPIIVYCQSGRRSAESADELVNLGYTKVYDMGSITTCYGEE